MNSRVDRRSFLKATGMLTAAVGLSGLDVGGAGAAETAKGAPNAEKLGWRLGCQAYSFNQFTFFEAVDKNASSGSATSRPIPARDSVPRSRTCRSASRCRPRIGRW